MSFSELARLVESILKYPLLPIQGQDLTLVDLAIFALFILVALAVARVLRASAMAAMDRRAIDDPGTRAITSRLITISVLSVGFATALTNVGINLAALFAAGAVFAVGISFAFQNVAQNFLSGLILLFERSIKPMDILEVEGRVVRVERLGIRATVARTRDDEQLIIPNTVLAQGTVKNYTMSDAVYRIRVTVGVTYDSDMRRVRQVLEETARTPEWTRLRDPVVFLRAFGDSSVNFEVSVWTQDPWTAPRIASDLHEAIWFALADADIVIAFPQLDVHFDPIIEESLTRLPRAS